MNGRDSIDNPVRPDFPRILIFNIQACFDSRAYNKRFGMSPTGKRDRALRGEETYE